MSKKLFILLLLVSLALVGCDWTTGNGNPETDRYYEGSEGVIMRFQPGTPPPRLFYYLNGDAEENSFEVSIELKNEGASDAIGATYISGFDPNLIIFQGVDIGRRGVNDCTFDITRLASGSDLQFFFDCGGISGGFGGAENWNIRINEIGELLGIDELEFWNSIGVVRHGDYWNLNIGWDDFGGIDVMNHGRALALVLSSIDWRNYNGFPYNGGQAKEGPGVLRGDNYYFPGGELGFQTFLGTIGHNWPAGLDETNIDFMITNCYGYTTYAAPEICIDPAPFDESDKVCTPQKHTWSGSQGAPVAITSLTQEPTPKKSFLTFQIRNVGGGRVFNLGYMERCSPYFPGRMDSRHTDVVYIGDIRIGQQRLDCTPGYEIRLNNGVGSFTCEYDLEYATAKTAYKTPVVIELWYGYQETMRTSTHVKRIA